MIYKHHRQAIDYIKDKLEADEQVDALLISGSISHGFNDEHSDVDINIIVPEAIYEQKLKEYVVTYWESAEHFYPGGYFDGKYISLGYLDSVAERGNEPTRFALHDVHIAFDKTGIVADYIKKISEYKADAQANGVRFLSQLVGWNWYCGEALKRNNKYLLDTAVAKLILFAGRLILLENRIFFPYHKWFMRVLEDAPNKPADFMLLVNNLLSDKSADNVEELFESVKNYKDWTGGADYDWGSNYIRDIETVWMRHDDFIENI